MKEVPKFHEGDHVRNGEGDHDRLSDERYKLQEENKKLKSIAAESIDAAIKAEAELADLRGIFREITVAASLLLSELAEGVYYPFPVRRMKRYEPVGCSQYCDGVMDVSDEGGYVLYAEFEVTRKKLVAAEEEIKRLREAAGKIEKCAIYAKGEYIAKIAREALGKKTKKEK